MMQKSDRSATKVLIVDDHPVVLAGCRSLFASDNTVKIEEANDAKSGYRAYLARKPDVTVIDIKLPDVSGFELMRRIRKDDPEARIIMFSMNDDPALVGCRPECGWNSVWRVLRVTRKYRLRRRGQSADRWVLCRGSASHRPCAC